MLQKRLSLFLLSFITTYWLQANDPFNKLFLTDMFADDIFNEMMHMPENMNKMFNRIHQNMQQQSFQLLESQKDNIDNKQKFIDKKDSYIYLTNIPENKENSIEINIEKGVMTIDAKIIRKKEHNSVRLYHETIILHKDIDESSIKMGYKNAYLVITMKKKKTEKIL
jgi:HSP20 family molecular chaperone IbpA